MLLDCIVLYPTEDPSITEASPLTRNVVLYGLSYFLPYPTNAPRFQSTLTHQTDSSGCDSSILRLDHLARAEKNGTDESVNRVWWKRTFRIATPDPFRPWPKTVGPWSVGPAPCPPSPMQSARRRVEEDAQCAGAHSNRDHTRRDPDRCRRAQPVTPTRPPARPKSKSHKGERHHQHCASNSQITHHCRARQRHVVCGSPSTSPHPTSFITCIVEPGTCTTH